MKKKHNHKKTNKKNRILNFFKQNQKKLLKYYYYFLPLWIILIIYSVIFMASANNFNDRKKAFEVKLNSSANSVMFDLRDQGLIRNKLNTKIAILLLKFDKKLHSGDYYLRPSMSQKEIFETLMEKRGLSFSSSIKVTIPEGYSVFEIMETFAGKKVIDEDIFKDYVANLDEGYWKGKYYFLLPNNLDNDKFLEGYLFADTYILAKNTSPEKIIDLMLNNFQTKIMPLIRNNSTGLKTHQLITLASIIEKEAVVAQERRRISGIFYNRLKRKMILGSCPTVKYALGRPRMKYLLYRHLDVQSPYNTYRHIGLPPGPICSPGIEAIKAALDPEKTSYLYFVAKGNGEHIFSYSLVEHLENQKMVTKGRIY